MTWLEVGELLRGEGDRFLKTPGVPDLSALTDEVARLPEVLLDLEQQTFGAVDEAARHFARTRQWPVLTTDQRTMLVFRLEYAASLCLLLGNPLPEYQTVIPEPSLDVPEEHLIEWALIHAWDAAGFQGIHDTLDRALSGRHRSNGI